MLVNVHDPFQGQFFKIKFMCLVKVGADRLGIMVDHNNMFSFFKIK